MKLLKVGRSSSCNIVLPSENVSSLHAEIVILDSGEVFLTDKNSANGTMVGNKKIVPNQEVQIRRGDLVVLGDSELPWSRVPQPDNNSGYKTVVNIGSNYRNDIQLTSEFASRFHAVVKVSANGRKIFIKDLNSKNGVKVNGLKILPNKEIQIKKGDNIICADQDITEDLKPYIGGDGNTMKWLFIAACCLLLLGVAGWLIKSVFTTDCEYCGSSTKCEEVQAVDMQTGVMMIQTRYYYVAKIKDNPLPEKVWDGTIKFDEEEYLQIISGTGFFVDEKGTIATNRHVACPWEYAEDDEIKTIKTLCKAWLQNATAYMTVISDQSQYNKFCRSFLGKKIDDNSATPAELNSMLSTILSSPIEVEGYAYARYVAYPGRNYTHLDEMERCGFIAESGTKDQDIALLQLNNPKTPDGCAIFSVEKMRSDELKPLQDEFSTIGYPAGLTLGLDDMTKKLQPHLISCRCSNTPSHYTFELQGMAIGGQSGSPVFDSYGHLVGMVSHSFNAGGLIKAVKATYIKELYNKELNYLQSAK